MRTFLLVSAIVLASATAYAGDKRGLTTGAATEQLAEPAKPAKKLSIAEQLEAIGETKAQDKQDKPVEKLQDKPPQDQPRPSIAPTESRSTETRPADVKPAKATPVETKTVETKSAAPESKAKKPRSARRAHASIETRILRELRRAGYAYGYALDW